MIMHTPTTLRELANAIEAAQREEPCEFYHDVDGRWCPASLDNYKSWIGSGLRYRPAPKQQMRAWSKLEDVPFNCWISGAHQLRQFRFFVICVDTHGIHVADASGCGILTWDSLSVREWTTDGITFHKCEVPA